MRRLRRAAGDVVDKPHRWRGLRQRARTLVWTAYCPHPPNGFGPEICPTAVVNVSLQEPLRDVVDSFMEVVHDDVSWMHANLNNDDK